MKRLLTFVAALLAAGALQAQQNSRPKLNGFRGDLMANLADTEHKILDLAESVPAEKYGWRPDKGVRSISEVFTHIAGSNYYLAGFLGHTAPAGVPKDIEKITDKKIVVGELRKSFDFLRGVIESEREADLDRAVKVFGTQMTHRGVLLMTVTHLHEHLGQSIAYARMNGVVPPWSR
jgi:uncharacterized damage-inducible protein DinB